MSNQIIQVPPDSTGKMVDCEELTVGANTVVRQRGQITGASSLEIAVVKNAAPASNAYGLVARVLKSVSAEDDGHSATLGATTDADTALTVIGRLKKLVTLLAGGLPAALVSGRLDVNIGAAPASLTADVSDRALRDCGKIDIAGFDVGLAAGTAHIGQVALTPATRADAFTGAANGTTVDVSTKPCARFAIAVKGTGAAPTSWTVVLEGSLDNANFSTILTHTNTVDSDGAIHWGGAVPMPVLYLRSRCTAVVLGGASNIVATLLGLP